MADKVNLRVMKNTKIKLKNSNTFLTSFEKIVTSNYIGFEL